ncbi:MAG: phosphate/phosphite/phosphonate ABC transporter substrate-binding protein [Geminicoccaceae bacterium]
MASLPMYEHPAVRSAMDIWWAALAEALSARGVAAPSSLDRRAAYADVWLEPGLVLSQTCGYPFVTRLQGRVQLVATPVYRVPGCKGARYRSVLVVRNDHPAQALAELRGRRAAFNGTDSQSGHNALRRAVAPLASQGRFFSSTIANGSHLASAADVASGASDLCAIDCVTWAMLGRHEAALVRKLRVFSHAPSAPALPLITGAATPLDAVREALAAVMADPKLAATREVLLLDHVEYLDAAHYDEILLMEQEARTLGYPSLA